MSDSNENVSSGTFVIRNRLGLHARCATQFVKKASQFEEVEVFVTKEGQRVNGKKIMDLLMLAAPLGTRLTLEVRGPDPVRANA